MTKSLYEKKMAVFEEKLATATKNENKLELPFKLTTSDFLKVESKGFDEELQAFMIDEFIENFASTNNMKVAMHLIRNKLEQKTQEKCAVFVVPEQEMTGVNWSADFNSFVVAFVKDDINYFAYAVRSA